MDVVVQRVRTSWTKKSRGGFEAARRNAAATAFLLPPGLSAALHEVTMRESESFEPRAQVLDLSAVGTILREVDGLLRVDPPEVSMFAMPRRNRRPPAVRLAPGQWLQWQINHRFVGRCDGAWSYRLETFNILYGSAMPDVFLGVPTRHMDERQSLR
ncbi:hypothetical protein DMH26_42835 [Streptomyces sp. WAC 05379]|uniref:hypothetical protein n=1 Tax=Streptomyces sp. WAC 05379 TaxID=2203207 RepID=UPI000F746410|nr:hypothetical protein [Streptomyces sp. WAC 05379]RSN73927.1 hypothetical protein DMH26_42835 [Streptomyces sp. WAC 05379]